MQIMKFSHSLLLVAAIALPLGAQAHSHLKQAMPANGSVLTTAPDNIMLMFSEAATLTSLSVQKTGEAAVQRIGPLPKDPAASFTIALPKLADGSYIVKYRVLSDDNHVMAGVTNFTIAKAPVTSTGK